MPPLAAGPERARGTGRRSCGGGFGSSLSPGMGHRIEVELTSQSDETTWTWRAAGAKLPRGTVDAALVPDGHRRGHRAAGRGGDDARRHDGDRAARPQGEGRAQADRADRDPRHPPEGPRRQRRPGRQGQASPGRRRRRRPRRRPSAGRPARAAPGSGDRGPRGDGPGPRGRRSADRRPADGGRSGREGAARTGPARPGGRESVAGTSRRRPTASTIYRNAALAELRPEQMPVAEQLLRGGIPSVRQAIDEQNTRARAEGRPEVTGHRSWPWPRSCSRSSTWPHGRTGPPSARTTGKDDTAPRAPLHRGLGLDRHPRRRGNRDGRRAAHQPHRAGHRPPRALGRAHHLGPRRRPGDRRRAGFHPSARALGPALGRAGRPPGRSGRSGHVRRDTARRVAGAARGGGGLPGAPDSQAGRTARPVPTRRC